jgi:hypothetical protein
MPIGCSDRISISKLISMFFFVSLYIISISNIINKTSQLKFNIKRNIIDPEKINYYFDKLFIINKIIKYKYINLLMKF